MQVVDVIARVDLLIAQAEEMAKQGDHFAAWELIQLAYEADADDAPMNRTRAKLALESPSSSVYWILLQMMS